MTNDAFLFLFLFLLLVGTPVLGFILRFLTDSNVRRIAVIVTYFYVICELRPVLTWANDPVFFPALTHVLAALGACIAVWMATSSGTVSESNQDKRS